MYMYIYTYVYIHIYIYIYISNQMSNSLKSDISNQNNTKTICIVLIFIWFATIDFEDVVQKHQTRTAYHLISSWIIKAWYNQASPDAGLLPVQKKGSPIVKWPFRPRKSTSSAPCGHWSSPIFQKTQQKNRGKSILPSAVPWIPSWIPHIWMP